MKIFFAARRARLCVMALLGSLLILQNTPVGADGKKTPPRALFALEGQTRGQKIAPGNAENVPAPGSSEAGGRITTLRPTSFVALKTAKKGEKVALPLSDSLTVEGTINLVQNDGDWIRVGGALDEKKGSFSLSANFPERDEDTIQVGGLVQLTKANLAYRLEQNDETAWVREVPLNAVLCHIPRPNNEPRGAAAVGRRTSAVPILNSRPSAIATVYMDFDGEVVNDISWNEGNTINALAYDLSDAQINQIFDRMEEDFAPFNLNITTDRAKYNAAPVGLRMRCIVTPTDAAGPGAGGIAYLNSFAQAGTASFSSTIPCWVFNQRPNDIAEAASHEIGHTFGLTHDGRNLPSEQEEYFEGHGSGATGWAPIMGASYYQPVTQWSKGEYKFANNQQDDLAIISNAANGFGYAADEAGDSRGAAADLSLANSTTPSQKGIITQASDADFYKFSTAGGSISLNAASLSSSPNLDIRLELQNSEGTVVASSNPIGALNASISQNLSPGNYFLKVQGTGEGDPLTTGYSNYGSIGAYVITGYLPPGLSVVGPATINEGDSGATNAVFTVSLSGLSNQTVTVRYATADGTATAPDDYGAVAATLTFAPGDLSKTVLVPVKGDLSQEVDETFSFNLDTPTGAGIAAATATVTIRDDDVQPVISVNSPSVAEGTTGNSSLAFVVSLNNPSGRMVTVDYATADGTATAPGDYTAKSGTLTFDPGESTKTVVVTIIGDAIREDDETLTLTLSQPTNATLSATQKIGTGTILEDDFVALALSGSSVQEGNSGTINAVFTATLAQASDQTITVDYATANGSAKVGQDFQAKTGQIVFAPGETSKTVAVAVIGDTTDENDETFDLVLSNPAKVFLPANRASSTILDDDAPPSLSIANVRTDEGSNLTFTATLSALSGKTVSVQYETTDGTAMAPEDYATTSGTISLAPDELTKQITVPIQDDGIVESDETLTLNLSVPNNVTLNRNSAQGTIIDDDLNSVVSVADINIFERNGETNDNTNAIFLVRLSLPNNNPVTVNYTTSDGTATAPGDYQATSGTLTFAPGQTLQTLDVPIIGDMLDELNETFTLTLSQVSNNAILGRNEATATIQDDEFPDLVLSDAAINEGDSGTSDLVFTANLSAPTVKTVSFNYNTADDTATTPSDYAAKNGRLEFAPGETSLSFTVTVQSDLVEETNETFQIELSQIVNAIAQQRAATGTIIDNDKYLLSIADASVQDDNRNATLTFPVTLSKASPTEVTVAYSTVNNTAKAGADYTAKNGQLVFAPGETEKNLVVSVLGDKMPESTKTFFLDLSDAVGAGLSVARATGTIKDTDRSYSIKGRVFQIVNGRRVGIAGVTIVRTGSNRTIQTDATGNYEFTNILRGAYTITATKEGLVFEPSAAQVSLPTSGTNLSPDARANFQTYTLTGDVFGGFGEPIGGVTITATNKSDGSKTTVQTGVKGHYRFPGLARGTYLIKASKRGVTFSPAERTVTLPTGGKLFSPNAKANFRTYAIRVLVVNGNDRPVANATVQLNGSLTAKTNALGIADFLNLGSGTYRLKVVSQSGFSVTPLQQTVVLPATEGNLAPSDRIKFVRVRAAASSAKSQ